MQVELIGNVFKGCHIWFESISGFKEVYDKYKNKYDFIKIWAYPTMINFKNVECNKQLSLITDLSEDIDSILRRASKTIRNEICRAEREGVICKYYDSQEILNNTDLRKAFSKTFHNMYLEKGQNNINWNEKEILLYAKNNSLLMSVAYIDSFPVVYHLYIVSSENARLYQSCSEFRKNNKACRNAIGRANKRLHYEDMLKMKSEGIRTYDWGGCASFTNPTGIDIFKMSFGGKRVEYYNVVVYLSVKYYLFNRVRNLVTTKK